MKEFTNAVRTPISARPFFSPLPMSTDFVIDEADIETHGQATAQGIHATTLMGSTIGQSQENVLLRQNHPGHPLVTGHEAGGYATTSEA